MGPNGMFAVLPALLSVVAWVLSISSTCLCSFVNRNVGLTGQLLIGLQNGATVFLEEKQGAGFWGWESQGTCYSYDINKRTPSFDIQFSMSSMFTTITDAIGGLATVGCVLGVLFSIDPSHYAFIGYLLLLVGCLDLATLLFITSDVCAPDFFNYALPNQNLSIFITSSCSLGTGAILAIVAGVCWFLAAAVILATDLAKSQRTDNTKQEAQPMTLYENSDSGSVTSYAQRRQTTEQRYHEVFGKDPSLTDGAKANSQVFGSSVTQKLSLLSEVSEHNNESDSQKLPPDDQGSEWEPQDQPNNINTTQNIQEQFHDEGSYQDDHKRNTDQNDPPTHYNRAGSYDEANSSSEKIEQYEDEYNDEHSQDNNQYPENSYDKTDESIASNPQYDDSGDEHHPLVPNKKDLNYSQKMKNVNNPFQDSDQEKTNTNPFDDDPNENSYTNTNNQPQKFSPGTTTNPFEDPDDTRDLLDPLQANPTNTNPFDESNSIRGPNPFDDESYEGSQASRSYRSAAHSQGSRSYASRSRRSQGSRSYGESYRDEEMQ